VAIGAVAFNEMETILLATSPQRFSRYVQYS